MEQPDERAVGFWATNTSDDRIWLLGLVLAVFPVPLLLGFAAFYYALRRIQRRRQERARAAGALCTPPADQRLLSTVHPGRPFLQPSPSTNLEWCLSDTTQPSAPINSRHSHEGSGKLPFSISEARSEELTIEAARSAVRAASASPPPQTPADAWHRAWHRPDSHPTAMATRVQEIDFSALRFVRPIGQGSFGSVFLATWQETTVAVKVMSPTASAAIATSLGTSTTAENSHPASPGGDAGTGPSPRSILRREAQLLARLRHPNVLLLMGYCTAPPCMVTEYCASGSLLDVLSLARRQPTFAAQLSWGRRLGMALDAAKGMLYLHGMGVCHRDLKSDNLMVDSHWRVKVADFNLAALLEGADDADDAEAPHGGGHGGAGVGSSRGGDSDRGAGQAQGAASGVANPRWLAPEVLSGGAFSAAADVYGYGLVLWELMAWALPWAEANALQIVLSVVDRRQRPEVPPPGVVQGGPPLQYQEYVALMQECWAQEPAARPSFDAVIRRVRALLAVEGGAG